MYSSPRDLVWEAWTRPEYFSQWFGHPLKTAADKTAMDLREGGKWAAIMIAPDGSDMPFRGTYREISKPEKLVMTFENVDDLNNPNIEVLMVTLKELDGKTEVTIHQAGHMPDEQYSKLVEGYTNFMNGMEKLLATLQ